MNCQHAKSLIAVEVLGGSDPDERAALEEHMRNCPSCARFFERAGKGPAHFDAPDDLPQPDWDKSWTRIAAEALDRPAARRVRRRSWKWAAAAASFLAVFAVGFLAGRRFLSTPRPVPVATAFAPAPVSLFQSYAESLEPVLIDFQNRRPVEASAEAAELRKKILRSMLAETRLLRDLADRSQDSALLGFLEEMESLLVSMSNLKPGDAEAAGLIDRAIRERGIRSKLRDLRNDNPIL